MLIDEELKTAICDMVSKIIREEVTSKLQNLETKVNELTTMQRQFMDMQATLARIETSVHTMDKALTFMNKEIEEIKSTVVPNLDKKYENVTTKTCMNVLDIDTHRRKWSLVINGLKGEQNESDVITRNKVKEFATNVLKVDNAKNHNFSACHRLSQRPDSGIIIKFLDLSDRNAWLMNAKNLKGADQNVSLSPDLHPCLRKLKNNILQIRKDLTTEEKRGSHIRFCPNWPYVYLKKSDQTSVYPQISKKSIVQDYLGMQSM